MKKQKWEVAADLFAEKWRNKKEVTGLLVAGSYITGNPSAHSDLDVCIVLKKGTKWRERGNEIVNGILVEYFANPPEQVEEYFKLDFQMGRRTMPHMYATGKIWFDKSGDLTNLKAQGKKEINKKFKPMNPFMLKTVKYLLWDSLDNLQEIYGKKTQDFEYVFFAHLQSVFNQYATFLQYGEVKAHKVYTFITDKKVQEKYNRTEFPDKLFVKNFVKCICEGRRETKIREITNLTKYVLNKMGGFEVDGFKFRSKIK